MNEITRRLLGKVNVEARQLMSFAIDVPLAAGCRHVAANEMPPPSIEGLIAKTDAALIALARKRGRDSIPRSSK